MEKTNAWLRAVDLSADLNDLPDSPLTFPDGGRFRVEIPEVENPEVLATMLRSAGEMQVPIHRASQGTGITRLSDKDLGMMASMSAAAGVDMFLFMGVRGENGPTSQPRSPAGGSARKRLQGADQLRFALADVERALEAGHRGFLISDEGLLWVLSELRERGDIPAEVALKTSVSMGHGNPASARVLCKLGADSFNLPVDLPLGAIAAIRRAIPIPLDVYVEAPADYGGANRFHEMAQLVRVASPVHLKFGLSTEVPTDPVGLHLQDVANAQVQERVRLAAVGLELLDRAGLSAQMSPVRPCARSAKR